MVTSLCQITENAQKILRQRYYAKDKDGNLLENSPEELFERVVNHVVLAEKPEAREHWKQKYLDQLLFPLVFLPNSPVLMNFGYTNGTGSACYVLSIKDTMDDISDIAKEAIKIEKYGGGVGFSLSNIRPKGFRISSTQGAACGPIAVLKYLSAGGKLVTQGGKRDGAHLAALSCFHPDIMEFIKCKGKEGDIHNFNISVGVNSNFMLAVQNDWYIHLNWPMDKSVYRFNADMEIYANKVALISYRENFLGVIVESKEINQMQRAAFELMWNSLQ